MPNYQIARDKASEVLSMIPHNPDEMIRTNDVIKAVEKKLNVDVKFTKVDFEKLAKIIGKRGSAIARCGAMMCVTNDGGNRAAAIFLNERETPEMVRFSLVHELGHLVTIDWDKLDACHVSTHIDMDITSIPDSVLNDPKYSHLIAEQRANIFALLVLIPYESLMNALHKNNSLAEVARFFGVEKDAVVSRLRLEKT